MQTIALRMSFLCTLSFSLQGDEEWSAAKRLQLPSTLTVASVRFQAAASAVSINSAIAAFSHHEPLASLELLFASHFPEEMSLAPLQTLPALQQFVCHIFFKADLAQRRQLREKVQIGERRDIRVKMDDAKMTQQRKQRCHSVRDGEWDGQLRPLKRMRRLQQL